MKDYDLNDIVEMKKGMDIKIECTGCGHIVMLPRREFERKMKKILEKAN